MSLMRSLYAGVSGLYNHQVMMDVIGNNISNVNSVGFKSSRVTFSDTFNNYVRFGTEPNEARGGTNAFQVGLGSQINSIDRNWNQGTFERTGIVTDMGLEGSGLFILKRQDQVLYSRNGAFTLDEEGYLVNPSNGLIVQGKTAIDSQGNIVSIPPGNKTENIQIDPNLRIPAQPTTFTDWGGNLKSDSALTRSELFKQTGPIDVNTTVGDTIEDDSIVYDEDGTAYTFKTAFTNNGGNNWDIEWELVDGDGNTIASSPAAVQAQFDPATGEMTSLDGNTPPVPLEINQANFPAVPLGIDFDYDLTEITEANAATTLTSIVDDGREPNIVSGSLTIYDSLGSTHSLTLKFTKTADNEWKWDATVPEESGTVTGGPGTITFNANGSIKSPLSPPIVQFTPQSGADPQAIQLDFGTGYDGITQTSATSVLSNLTQNGSAQASLENLAVDQWGGIIGIFSNGESKTLAQVMVAKFPNLSGMVAVGENLFNSAPNSGVPFIAEPGETVNTYVRGGYLEQSNVDLAEEFTKMIIAQRGYQANARVITTSDNMIQEVTNLVR
jgi:flagellar hook protein FlgE